VESPQKKHKDSLKQQREASDFIQAVLTVEIGNEITSFMLLLLLFSAFTIFYTSFVVSLMEFSLFFAQVLNRFKFQLSKLEQAQFQERDD
jgi:hypothetical protein